MAQQIRLDCEHPTPHLHTKVDFQGTKIFRHFMKFSISKKSIDAQTPITRTSFTASSLYSLFYLLLTRHTMYTFLEAIMSPFLGVHKIGIA